MPRGKKEPAEQIIPYATSVEVEVGRLRRAGQAGQAGHTSDWTRTEDESHNTRNSPTLFPPVVIHENAFFFVDHAVLVSCNAAGRCGRRCQL